MTMADEDMKLDDLFAQARRNRPALPDDLAVRIQTDAESVGLDRVAIQTRPKRSLWTRLLGNIGGWQGCSGLAVASVTGICIGLFAPAFLPDPASLLNGEENSFLASDLGFDTSFLESTE